MHHYGPVPGLPSWPSTAPSDDLSLRRGGEDATMFAAGNVPNVVGNLAGDGQSPWWQHSAFGARRCAAHSIRRLTSRTW